MSPMRVLMTADTVGGVWTYALTLCEQLAQRGCEVVLATMGGEPSAAQRREVEAIGGGPGGGRRVLLEPGGFKLEWMEDPWDDVARAGEWLLGLARQHRPRLVHLNGYAHGALPWGVPVVVVGHSCVVSWWRAVKGEEPPPKWDRYRDAVRAGVRGADAVVAPTRAMLAELERWCGPLPAPTVIYNGCDGAGALTAERDRVVLCAGRVWDEGKNLAAMERAAPRLAWPVVVAGDGEAPGGGSGAPVAAAAGGAVHRLGRLPPAEMRAWMGRAAIFAHPARYEPFGLAPLEAAGAGCALVLGDIPTLREVWGARDGEPDAAVFVDPADEDAIVAAVGGLIEDDGARLRMAEAARRRAGRYTCGAMGAAYRRLYRRVLAYRAMRATPPAPAAAGLQLDGDMHGRADGNPGGRSGVALPEHAEGGWR